jgi:hypothetical protein
MSRPYHYIDLTKEHCKGKCEYASEILAVSLNKQTNLPVRNFTYPKAPFYKQEDGVFGTP